jgi:hypothetical protein
MVRAMNRSRPRWRRATGGGAIQIRGIVDVLLAVET